MITPEEKELLNKAIALNISNIANGMIKSSGTFRLSEKNPTITILVYTMPSIIRIDIKGLIL